MGHSIRGLLSHFPHISLLLDTAPSTSPGTTLACRSRDTFGQFGNMQPDLTAAGDCRRTIGLDFIVMTVSGAGGQLPPAPYPLTATFLP